MADGSAPTREILNRIRMEYTEMPDLKLTPSQARRLWNLSQEACERALSTLVAAGFLQQSRDGEFLRRDLNGSRGVIARALVGVLLVLGLAAPAMAQFDT